jgi:DNA repair protein RadC
MTFTVRDMPPVDRPRDRLLALGAQTLTDAELLAVILGTGIRGKNALQLAEELLAGGLHDLRGRDLTTLAATRGLGRAKVAQIAAALELSRRMGERP